MDFEEKYIKGIRSSKRANIMWTPWMGDWFVSNSPRNDNSHAEGTWDHWVQLAISILQHPATEIVRPEAFAAVSGLANSDFYSESGRKLTDDEVGSLFGEGGDDE